VELDYFLARAVLPGEWGSRGAFQHSAECGIGKVRLLEVFLEKSQKYLSWAGLGLCLGCTIVRQEPFSGRLVGFLKGSHQTSEGRNIYKDLVHVGSVHGPPPSKSPGYKV
jgi:hypothetical protein